MPKKNEQDADEAAETVELDGSGNKDGAKNSRKQRQKRSRAKRVRVIGIAAAVVILIVIVIAAWFIYLSLSDEHPEWLQTIPGLHYRPKSMETSSLIYFKHNEPDSYKPWVEVIDDFLKEYSESYKNNSEIMSCNYDNPAEGGKVCAVSVKDFSICNSSNQYGYPQATPCIFLKIHKFPGWVPEYYNDSSLLPETMPDYLKAVIVDRERHNPSRLNNVWVSCEGENPADVENIGPIIYFPQSAFPGYYFPNTNVKGYMSPLVAVYLERPPHGILINVECKLWAKNIAHDREQGIGLVHFEIMID